MRNAITLQVGRLPAVLGSLGSTAGYAAEVASARLGTISNLGAINHSIRSLGESMLPHQQRRRKQAPLSSKRGIRGVPDSDR